MASTVASQIFQRRNNGELKEDFRTLVEMLENSSFSSVAVVISAYLTKYGVLINPEKIQLIFLDNVRGTPVIRIRLEGGNEISINENDIFIGD